MAETLPMRFQTPYPKDWHKVDHLKDARVGYEWGLPMAVEWFHDYRDVIREWIDSVNARIEKKRLSEISKQPKGRSNFTRKNHFIPQFWLRLFADHQDPGHVSLFDTHSRTFEKAGINTGNFQIKDLYNVVRCGKLGATVEHSLSIYENDIRHLIIRLSVGDSRVTPFEKYQLAHFVFLSMTRVPRFIELTKDIVREAYRRRSVQLEAWQIKNRALNLPDEVIAYGVFYIFARQWVMIPSVSTLGYAMPMTPVIHISDRYPTGPDVMVVVSPRTALYISWDACWWHGRDVPKLTFAALKDHNEHRLITHPRDAVAWRDAHRRVVKDHNMIG